MNHFIMFAMALVAKPYHGQTQTTAAQAAQSPCNVPVPETDATPWRLVRASGFTFCVPADWKPVGKGNSKTDAKTWRGSSGSVTWAMGLPPSAEQRHLVNAVATVSSSQLSVPPSPPPQPPLERRVEELIDNRNAQLWDRQVDHDHSTGVSWEKPRIYLKGDARDLKTVQLEFAVYRTVRFALDSAGSHP